MPSSKSHPQNHTQEGFNEIDLEIFDWLANLDANDQLYPESTNACKTDNYTLAADGIESASTKTGRSDHSLLESSSSNLSQYGIFSSLKNDTSSSNSTKKRKNPKEPKSLSEEEKEIKRQRNRELAAKSRKTNKEKVAKIIQENQELIIGNQKLTEENRALFAENRALFAEKRELSAENQELKNTIQRLEEKIEDLLEVKRPSTFSAV